MFPDPSFDNLIDIWESDFEFQKEQALYTHSIVRSLSDQNIKHAYITVLQLSKTNPGLIYNLFREFVSLPEVLQSPLFIGFLHTFLTTNFTEEAPIYLCCYKAVQKYQEKSQGPSFAPCSVDDPNAIIFTLSQTISEGSLMKLADLSHLLERLSNV